MIEEIGTVVAISGDCAQVRTERRSSCGGCAVDGACATSLLDRFLGRRAILLNARNRIGAQVGERVVVGVRESHLMGAAVAAYLVPVLALMIGAGLGQWLGDWGLGSPSSSLRGGVAGPVAHGGEGDLGALFGGFLGFVLALAWLRRYSARLARDAERQPVILRRQGDALSVSVSLPGV